MRYLAEYTEEKSFKTLRYPRTAEIFHVTWRNSTPHFVLLPKRRNENNLFPLEGIEYINIAFKITAAAPR